MQQSTEKHFAVISNFNQIVGKNVIEVNFQSVINRWEMGRMETSCALLTQYPFFAAWIVV